MVLHKNLQSINNYSHLSEGRMENISSIISGNVVDVSSCSQSMRSSGKTTNDTDAPTAVLQHAIINGGEFHFHIGSSYKTDKVEHEQKVVNRRRVIISDDSSQEE